jgi:hypothetical protein
MLPDLQYTANGYEYRTYLDIEEDNQKIFHYCYKDGVEIKMPYEFYNHSPYSYMPKDKFVAFTQHLVVFLQSKVDGFTN